MDVFDIVATLRLDSTKYKAGLSEAKGEAKEFGDESEGSAVKGGKLANLMKNGMAVAAKVGAAATAAASVAIVKLGKDAVQAYAQYEQLVGGVDTLFKESSQLVQQYASEAYKTAGMSANAYMENVTAFSASLLQSLGGDTKAAADYANQAMIDMSDNANKMGTSIDSIVATYQSLSRGNFAICRKSAMQAIA